MKLNLPYFPNRKKNEHTIINEYYKIFCSVIFEGNINFIKGKNIIFGGTGFDLTTILPNYIENLKCDYSLYPDNDISYGFITRGCIRNCSFCKVPKKEGYIHRVNDVKYKNTIKDKLKILSWRKDFQFKFFVYINPSMKLEETVQRIEWLKKNKCLPYIMRDITCWNSQYNNFYIDIAAYCNQPNLFKKLTFEDFLNKRHTNTNRISESLNLYNKGL